MRQLREEEIKKLHMMAANKGKIKLTAAIYARKSREDKTDTSLSTQVSECETFIKSYEGLMELGKDMVFQEDNVSGMQVENRKELAKLLKLVEERSIDVVVVLRSDRFSRSSELMVELINRLDENDAYVIAGDDLGDNSAAGILIKQIFWATNEFFVRKSVEDVMLVHSKLVENGYTVGGPGNYGYDIVNRKYVINPEEALAVNMIFDMFLEGCSYTEIAQNLNIKGLKPRKSERFAHSTIHAILSNKRNAGVSIWNDQDKRRERKRVSKQHYDAVVSMEVVAEPIVDQSKFKRVQELLEKRTIGKSKSTHTYLLSGLTVCGICGEAITGNSQRSGRNKQVYRTYYCKNHKKKHGGTCLTKPIKVEYLESVIKEQITTLINNQLKKNGLDSNNIDQYFDANKLTISRLKREITLHETLLEKMTRGLYEVTSKSVKAATEKEIEKVSKLVTLSSEKLNHLISKQEIFSKKVSTLNNGSITASEIFENNELAKRIIRLFISKVTISNTEIEIDFN